VSILDPCLLPPVDRQRELPCLGEPTLDRYLLFVSSRARWNTVLATASDLRAFFAVIDQAPHDVAVVDVLAFIAEQLPPRVDGVVRLSDGEAGLSSRTIKRNTGWGVHELLHHVNDWV
jgi:hypothetical protein